MQAHGGTWLWSASCLRDSVKPLHPWLDVQFSSVVREVELTHGVPGLGPRPGGHAEEFCPCCFWAIET